MYKNFIPIIIIIILVIIAIVYIKHDTLYKPYKPVTKKYIKFINNITHLAELPQDVIKTFVKTSDDQHLDTFYVRNRDSNKCIIYLHGNTGNISMRYDIVKFLHNYASVVIFDYRSFGRSSGNKHDLNSEKLNIDAMSIWLYVINILKYHPNDISIYGESLGCSVAIKLVAEITQKFDIHYHPHSLILVSPFFSLSSMIEYDADKLGIKYIGKMVSKFLGNEYQSQKMIPFVSYFTKIIVAHSQNDDIIPYSQGKKLYQIINETHPNVKFIDLMGTHNKLELTDHYIYTLADLFE
ncbi:peptidase S9 [Acanthamoeba polyphaga mimivirus]|uniref:Peptidase S9 n=3 Tax=Megamimivirinae TaxID=3044648 RepID=A0A2L2DJS3_MIMIV|nr:putative peptidase S9 [Megavirus courdo11]AGD92658.1 putative peptidase S9 [Megavirus lba]AVG46433.1 peptidase S9 [Acanthamoeba polyphaga mimivirus]